MNDRILLIEDDNRLAEMVKDYLGAAGFEVTISGSGSEGMNLHKLHGFEAIILDLNLPDMDGLDVCRELRAQDNVPILMLTAKGDPMDRVVGLEIGADDYVPKPFEPRELLARLKAILRRGKSSTPTDILKFGRLEIDRDAMIAKVGDKACDLTTHQFKLLEIMAGSAGRVLSRTYLADQLNVETYETFDRSIDVHISRIRSEIEDDPKHPKRVITVRGAGYVFARSQD